MSSSQAGLASFFHRLRAHVIATPEQSVELSRVDVQLDADYPRRLPILDMPAPPVPASRAIGAGQ